MSQNDYGLLSCYRCCSRCCSLLLFYYYLVFLLLLLPLWLISLLLKYVVIATYVFVVL